MTIDGELIVSVTIGEYSVWADLSRRALDAYRQKGLMGDDRSRPARAGRAFLLNVANVFAGKLPDMGFALIVFPFGNRGNVSYISNAHPADIATPFRYMADRLESAEGVPSASPGLVDGRPN